MAKNPNWSSEERERLGKVYPHYSNKELEQFFPGRTQIAIQHIGNRSGWKKSTETMNRILMDNRAEWLESYRKDIQINKDGYVLIKKVGHPTASKDGLIMQHRLVMEEHLGRLLSPDELVHHINGNKADNRIENLQVISQSEHSSLHNRNRVYGAEMRRKISEKMKQRLSDKTRHPSYKSITQDQIKNVFLLTGSVKETCDILGITRRTFYNKLAYLGLEEWYSSVKSDCVNR